MENGKNEEMELSKKELKALERERKKALKEQRRRERESRKQEKRQARDEEVLEGMTEEWVSQEEILEELGFAAEGEPEWEEASEKKILQVEDNIVLETTAQPQPAEGEEAKERMGEAEGEREPEEEKVGWFARLKAGLAKSRTSWINPLSRAMASRRFDADFWEEVEEILIGADVGVEMTQILLERLRDRIASENIKEPERAMEAFAEELAGALRSEERDLRFNPKGTCVFLMVGVNGTGKTTTIAKLAHMLKNEGKKVILAAADTFRAAGIEQLEIWGERVGVHTVKHRQGADAAAVAFDAIQSAKARGMDVVIVDTAGRLHTKVNLMEELKKIKRVAEREAPVTESLLVIDATTGQNGLVQAKLFQEAIDITGVVLTKLDGTARGGIVVAIQHELGIPIKLIGVGEGLEDLHLFDPEEFSRALFAPGV